jgi:arylsulfatase A
MPSHLERRDFLRLLLAGGAAASLPAMTFLPACRKAVGPPNIVLFLADDLGYGDLGCYGNPINRTPHLDRFASEGMRFTDFHAAGTVCSPSRASLLTGRHPYRLGFYYILGGGAHLRREEVTIASLLRKAGYDTCFVGKWHLTNFDKPQLGQPTPADHGFDHWFATVLNAFEGPENPEKFFRDGEKVGPVSGWYCDAIVDEAARWLRGRDDPDKPFFLLVCSHEPHTPLAPPEEDAALYDNLGTEELAAQVEYGRVPRPKDKDIAANKKYYYGTVTQLDRAFGTLMRALEGLGLRDETLAVFTSDNGPEYPVNLMESQGEWDDPIRDRCFGTPGPLHGMKRFTTEGGHRVPGLVRWPGHIPSGAVSDALINGTDILPTLCELAGMGMPSDRVIDGESALPAFFGEPFQRRGPICWNFPVHEYEFVPPMAMREGNFVLLAWFNDKAPNQLWMDWIKTAGPVRYELYDLDRDLGQARDLGSEMPDKVKVLAGKLGALWKDIQAEAPVWERWKAK